MATTIQLPDALRPFSEQLLPTQRSFIRMNATGDRPFAPWESAIGGVPYWLQEEAYPTDSQGNHLLFLIQINFSELPKLEPLPQEGLLQIFINDDDGYGMNFDDPTDQSNFRMIYREDIHEDMEKLLSDFSFLENQPTGPFESRLGFGLEFSIETELMPHENHQFNQFFGSDFFKQFGDQEWDVAREYRKVASGMGHKLGGYPFFTQEDPRSADSPLKLLLQVDTDVDVSLMWGDMGVANFFIHPDDLKKLDFSKVYYNWDCH